MIKKPFKLPVSLFRRENLFQPSLWRPGWLSENPVTWILEKLAIVVAIDFIPRRTPKLDAKAAALMVTKYSSQFQTPWEREKTNYTPNPALRRIQTHTFSVDSDIDFGVFFRTKGFAHGFPICNIMRCIYT